MYLLNYGFSGYAARSRIAGSYVSSIFSFLRNMPSILHNSCTNLHSHRRFYFLHTLSSIVDRLFDASHADCCEVIPHCSFDLHFSNSDVEHLFTCLLAINMSSLEKHLFRSSTRFFDWFFSFFILSCMSCLCILEMNHFFASIFSWGLSFCLVYGFLCCEKAFKFH